VEVDAEDGRSGEDGQAIKLFSDPIMPRNKFRGYYKIH